MTDAMEIIQEAVDAELDTSDTITIRREHRATLAVGDGRTVDVLIAPYGERIEANDGAGGVPRGVVYQEEFLPGFASHQLNAPFRVTANVEHERGIAGKVGHGVTLVERSDGLHGTFRLLETQAGETARQLIEAGSLDGVSIEADRVKDIRRGSIVQRAKMNVKAIAFTAYGAYKGARILAIREEMPQEPQILDADLLVSDLDPRLVERCRRLGIQIPQRYEHPAPTDTPDESGTSGSGTLEPVTNTDSEE